MSTPARASAILPGGQTSCGWVRMSYLCPQCDGGAMESVGRISLPADSRSDEITLHLVNCDCGFFGVVLYEESRRGALDSECWDLSGLIVPLWLYRQLRQLLEDCPGPDNSQCDCEAHSWLGSVEKPSGRLFATVSLPSTGFFPVRLSSW